jgi:hypothetical protein
MPRIHLTLTENSRNNQLNSHRLALEVRGFVVLTVTYTTSMYTTISYHTIIHHTTSHHTTSHHTTSRHRYPIPHHTRLAAGSTCLIHLGAECLISQFICAEDFSNSCKAAPKPAPRKLSRKNMRFSEISEIFTQFSKFGFSFFSNHNFKYTNT